MPRLKVAWEIAKDVGKLVFALGKFVVGLLIGLGVGTINLFAKRKIGWGLANRVEDGLSGINLLSYGSYQEM
jgi:hypothetical protein